MRSGGVSLGGLLIEHDGDKRTFTGAPRPKGILQQDNRVLSFACKKCGHFSRFLERVIRDHPGA